MALFRFRKEKKEDASSKGDASQTQQQVLEEEVKDMIEGVKDLSQTTVKEVMVPRIDVDFIALGTPQEELLKKVTQSGHSRFPVYTASIDNVVGVLYVKDLIAAFSRHEEINLEKIIRKAYFVPESKRIDSLLREFKRRHIHIAFAIDEYGGISGIVCMEDIIEEIVGDIQDEFDKERADITPLANNVWLCDARVGLEDLNETVSSLGAPLPTENFDTLGGFVFDLFGRIPVKFEKVSWNDYDFIVQEMEGHKVNVIKVILRKNNEGKGEK